MLAGIVSAPPEEDEHAVPLIYEGAEPLEVTGEARHQDTLRTIADGQPAGRGDATIEIVAELRPEPLNPLDAHAVAVLIDGEQIGYLTREAAAACAEGITRLMQLTARPVALRGALVGGYTMDDGSPAHYGVWLRYDPTDFEH